MKQFKPFEKVLVRISKDHCWTPTFYQYHNNKSHFVFEQGSFIFDDDIIPYEGNEHLVGFTGEPEEIVTLEKGELILCNNNIYMLKEGLGTITSYGEITGLNIKGTNGAHYIRCIPMSKYNVNNIEETNKWILEVKSGRLVKVNK